MQSCSLPAAAAGVTAVSLSTAYWNSVNQPTGQAVLGLPSPEHTRPILPNMGTVAIASKYGDSMFLQCFSEDIDPHSMDEEDLIASTHLCCMTFWKAAKGFDDWSADDFLNMCFSEAARGLPVNENDPLLTYFIQSTPTSTSAMFQPDPKPGLIFAPPKPIWEHSAWADSDTPYLTWGQKSAEVSYGGNKFLNSIVHSFLPNARASEKLTIESTLDPSGGMHREWLHTLRLAADTKAIQYRLQLSADTFINIEDAVEVVTPGYNISLQTASLVIDQEAPTLSSPQHSVLVTVQRTPESDQFTSTVVETRTKLHLRYPPPHPTDNFVRFELLAPLLVGQLPKTAPVGVWTSTGYLDDFGWILGSSVLVSVLGALVMLYSLHKL